MVLARLFDRLEHPVSYLVNLPVLNPIDKIAEDLTYTSKHNSCTYENQVLPSAAKCGHGSGLKYVIWHNFIYMRKVWRDRTLNPVGSLIRGIYSLFRVNQVQQAIIFLQAKVPK
jgi:hypothetical protein